jgi:hypothetical protein
MQPSAISGFSNTKSPSPRSLLLSRLAMAIYVISTVIAILFRREGLMFIGVLVSFIPLIVGPMSYRIVGLLAGLGAFLAIAVIRLS